MVVGLDTRDYCIINIYFIIIYIKCIFIPGALDLISLLYTYILTITFLRAINSL